MSVTIGFLSRRKPGVPGASGSVGEHRKNLSYTLGEVEAKTTKPCDMANTLIKREREDNDLLDAHRVITTKEPDGKKEILKLFKKQKIYGLTQKSRDELQKILKKPKSKPKKKSKKKSKRGRPKKAKK